MADSVLNKTVSAFANYNTSSGPKDVNLLHWLTSPKYASKVEAIRAEPDKNMRDRIKATLPAITPHGTFTYRNSTCLIKHSGFLQFDIDLKENRTVTNYEGLKKELCKVSNVAYCGLSVSGTGYWGLIPIAYPDRHHLHFDYMKQAFFSIGITIDSKPRNVAALRGYSYDPEGYFNHSATILERYNEPPPPKHTNYSCTGDKTRSQVEALINEINITGTDITPNYERWLSLGFAFASEFGESGRSYFHDVSQHYSGYNYAEADRQFSYCLKSGGGGITINTFFYLSKVAGITFKIL